MKLLILAVLSITFLGIAWGGIVATGAMVMLAIEHFTERKIGYGLLCLIAVPVLAIFVWWIGGYGFDLLRLTLRLFLGID